MLFDDLSRRLEELKNEIAELSRRNDEYAEKQSHSRDECTEHDNRQMRLEHIKQEIATILKQL